ncbi:transporter [Ferruginibacter sp. SUN106]|uniref:transporter n=1 Tax=Ferruginibacter sp. SUN106 TaxID=2978348 RepID=UPI003D36FB1E
MLKLILYFVLITMPFIGFAQTERIITDRPGKTNTAFTVPKKWIQSEIGFLKEVDKFSPPYRDIYFQHPSLLTKYGLGKRLELRIKTEWGTIKNEASNLTQIRTGITNVEVGGMVNLFNEKGIIPKTSFIANYNFHSLRTTNNDSIDGANLRFAFHHTISETISLNYNIGLEWERFGDAPAYIYTISPKFNIDDNWEAYIEAFGFIWKNNKPQNSIDGGIAYYVNNNFKVDASAGFGLNKEAPDIFFTVGASFRFKTNNK